MLALLAAATVSAALTPAAPTILIEPVRMQAKACGMWDAQPVKRQGAVARAQRLDQLPAARHERTVLRLDENGCSKAVIVRENVAGDGRFARPR